MRYWLMIIMLLGYTASKAQELYVFTEPASNMPAKSLGARLDNMLMQDRHKKSSSYTLSPELMLGASRNIMLHAAGYFDNEGGSFSATGASVYLKYRFLSSDEVHDHFRMAAFGKIGYNNSAITDIAITPGRGNSAYESGIVATRLIKKLALSSSLSFVHAMDNGKNVFAGGNKRNALNYTLSAGKLMLPKEYTSYKQTNVNFMLELLGQTNFAEGYSYIDAAPSVQFIINSQTRIDLGYRFNMIKSMERNTERYGLLRIEYTFFNAIR